MSPVEALLEDISRITSDAYHAELLAQARKESWADDQDRILIKHYPNIDRLRDLLPQRSMHSCMRRAQVLGLRARWRAWSSDEILWLRKNYSTALWSEIEEHLPRRTKSAVKARAWLLKLRRDPKESPLIGVYVIDEIRMRAKELNFTLRDLDEVAGLKQHFRTMRAKSPPRTIRLKTMNAVLDAMGGRLVVKWSDE